MLFSEKLHSDKSKFFLNYALRIVRFSSYRSFAVSRVEKLYTEAVAARRNDRRRAVIASPQRLPYEIARQ
jgi:hypothetical protein